MKLAWFVFQVYSSKRDVQKENPATLCMCLGIQVMNFGRLTKISCQNKGKEMWKEVKEEEDIAETGMEVTGQDQDQDPNQGGRDLKDRDQGHGDQGNQGQDQGLVQRGQERQGLHHIEVVVDCHLEDILTEFVTRVTEMGLMMMTLDKEKTTGGNSQVDIQD